MDSRERVKRAIRFQKPDRVPISHAVLPAAQFKSCGQALSEILMEFREDFQYETSLKDLPLEKFPACYKQGRHKDDFGTLWQVEWMGVCGIPVEFPIPDLSRYDAFVWPEDFTAGPPSGRQSRTYVWIR